MSAALQIVAPPAVLDSESVGVIPYESLWTVSDAANFLRMSRDWVYRAAERGDLPYRKVGANLRFVPSELRAWLDEQVGG